MEIQGVYTHQDKVSAINRIREIKKEIDKELEKKRELFAKKKIKTDEGTVCVAHIDALFREKKEIKSYLDFLDGRPKITLGSMVQDCWNKQEKKKTHDKFTGVSLETLRSA